MLLTATDLVQWADRRSSQDTLPLLVRQLILAKHSPLVIDFPVGDSINQPGFDGILNVAEDIFPVPTGASVWELGVERSPTTKANEDYSLRTQNPGLIVPSQNVFVFVTPRRWRKKAEWVRAKSSEKIWREVIGLDADDLELWLSQCPAVAGWFCRLVKSLPPGIRDVEEVWQSYATQTDPPLAPSLLVAGRTNQVQSVQDWLTGPAKVIRIRAETSQEALVFVAAVAELFDQPRRNRTFARTVVVTAPDAWRALSGQPTPVVLVATEAFGGEQAAASRGHHVAVVYGNDYGGAVNVDLGHLRRPHLDEALSKMGVERDRTSEIATESKGRISAIIDLLSGGTVSPGWAAPAVGHGLLPFLLAGSWSERGDDMSAVARLGACSTDEINQRVSIWANVSDPPLRNVGGLWEWVSRQRAWPHLARHLMLDDLAIFRRVALEVLQRNASSGAQYSDDLKRGIAESLIMLSTPETNRTGVDLDQFVRTLVRDLFGESASPETWLALCPFLSRIAEAAPAEFLAAAERDVVGSEAVREALFRQEGYVSASHHHYLMFALETVAWSPQHLTETALILGGIAATGIGNTSGNRPMATLRSVFLSWYPNTSASLQQRLAALDALYSRHPDVAFRLCAQLIPRRYDTCDPTATPLWRRWLPSREDGIGDPTSRECSREVINRLLRWAEGTPHRLATILSPIAAIGRVQIDRILTSLESLRLEAIADEADVLRRAVRHVLHTARTVEGAYPGMEDFEARFDAVYARLEPSDLVLRDAWLFDNHVDLVTLRGFDFHAEQAELERLRRESALRLGATEDLALLSRFASIAENIAPLGVYIGQSDLSDTTFEQLVEMCFADSSDSRRLMPSVVWGRFQGHGLWTWARSFFARPSVRAWTSIRKARFAAALPFGRETWDWVEELGADVLREYWRFVSPHWVENPITNAERAILAFLDHDRPVAAFHVVRQCLDRDESELRPEVQLLALRGLTQAATTENCGSELFSLTDISAYDLDRLLASVEACRILTDVELSRLEWVWLPLLRSTQRGPASLFRVIAAEPTRFVEIIGLMFRRRGTNVEEQPTKAEQARAHYAFECLNEWTGVPGLNSIGVLDASELTHWVLSARDGLRSSGNLEMGDMYIGEILARVPIGVDGLWPHEGVRDLVEQLTSDALDEGIFLGIVNGRGVTCRSPYDGGEQEIELSQQYANTAAGLARYPRTSKILTDLANNYRADARREDIRRDQDEFRR